MRFASLGSGSGGNALVVEAGASRLMIDCGLGLRELEARLLRLGLAPADLSGILITHEHDDHVGGAFSFAERHALPVWITYGTLSATLKMGTPNEATVPASARVIDSHSAFAVGDLEVFPFPVPHDAREPVQYVLSDGAARLGVLTDIGMPTRHVIDTLSGCDALVLECNHDVAMLARSPYPSWLKARVGGNLGHLSNDQAESLLGALDRSRLKHVVAAHLSESNNLPALAQAALARALGCTEDWVGVASQSEGFGWRDL